MKKVLFIGLLSAIISACSSGGGNNGNKNLIDHDYNNKVRAEKNVVLVDGTRLQLTDLPHGIIERNVVGGTLKAINFTYSAAGAVIPNGVSQNRYGFMTDPRITLNHGIGVYGVQTEAPNLPANGIAIYNGQTVGANSQGKIRLDVDFGVKTTSGKLYDQTTKTGKKLTDIDLHRGSFASTDRGISFGGVATSGGSDLPAVYSGVFMGPKAEEVAGVVADTSANPYAFFAASRENSTEINKNRAAEFQKLYEQNKQ